MYNMYLIRFSRELKHLLNIKNRDAGVSLKLQYVRQGLWNPLGLN